MFQNTCYLAFSFNQPKITIFLHNHRITHCGVHLNSRKIKQFGNSYFAVFQYSSSESVDEVTKENFKTCNTNKVLATFGNGNTTVPLTKPGDRYFVSGNKMYCLGGMKLHVHVEADNAYSPAPAPAPAKAVTGLNGASVLPRQPASSKKNTPLTNGAVTVNCAKNIAPVVAFVFWMFQI